MIPIVRRSLTVIAAVIGPSLAFPSLTVAQHTPVQPSQQNVSIPAEGDSVPMLDFGGRPVVEVMINGKGPYKFIFDTGASLNVLDTSVTAELGLDDHAGIQELRLGKISVRQLAAFSNPISQMLGGGDVPRGVLSASSFPGNLVIFDFPGKRIAFRNGTLPSPDKKTVFSYDPSDLPAIPVNVAGREVTVHLDTGAPYALALPTKYMKELPLSGPPVQKGNAKTHGGSLPIYLAPLDGAIGIGSFKLSTHDLRFTDVVPFGGAEPRGQLGSEALRDLVMTLDSLNHRIELKTPSPAAR
ncbi:MAG: aspartyl protease family protein [Chthoniobacterales bacterium]